MTAIMQYWVNGCTDFSSVTHVQATFLISPLESLSYYSFCRYFVTRQSLLLLVLTTPHWRRFERIHQSHIFHPSEHSLVLCAHSSFFNMILLNSWSKIIHTKIWYRFRHSEELTLETSEHYLFTVGIWPFKNLCDTQFCVSLSHRQGTKNSSEGKPFVN